LKDQTNLIVVIVAIVFMIGFSLAFALTQRKPVALTAPAAVPLTEVQPAEGAVVYANALPNAGSAAAGGAGGADGEGGGRGAAGGRRGGPVGL
jgi:hypothetical protein